VTPLFPIRDIGAGAIELAGARAPKFLTTGARRAQHKFTGTPLKDFPAQNAEIFYHWNVFFSYQCLLLYDCSYAIIPRLV